MARYVDVECNAVTEVIGRRAFRNRSDIQDFLDNIPTADVVPVVRCKDCKHFMEYTEDYAQIVGEADGDCYIRQMNTYYNEKFCGVKLNDYCSYGERRCE